MNDREIIEIYKKEIELFLGMLSIRKGNTIINTNSEINLKNKEFILSKMDELKAGNYQRDLMNLAIDELLPYLRDFGEHDLD
mgnify:CR=1 FL=1